MSSEWPLVRVEDVCSLIVDCVNKTAPVSEQPTPFRMIRTTNVRNGRIDLSECKFVDEETFKKWTRRAEVRAGDVILTREAPIGEVGAVPDAEGLFLGQRLMQYRADRSKLDQRFLLYSFLSPQLQHQFGSHEGSGSVVSHIRVGDCFKFELRLPPLPAQQKIGEILGALDDKIDLNRRINQTLEAMAQAIFKSWFIDFDPVKAKIAAKAEGRDPLRAAMSAISGKADAELDALPHEQYEQLAATAALFPDEMEESELGEIPKGWSSAALSGIADVVMGQSPDGETYNDIGHGTPLINGPVEFDSYHPKRIKWTTQPTKFCQLGDLIVCVRGSTTGKFVKSDGVYCLGRGVCAIRAREPGLQPFVDEVYKFSLSALLSLATGSTFPNWSGPTLKNYRILKPAIDVMEAYSQLMTPALSQISSNERQTESLQILRDSILPKLLSGELSVEEFTEPAGAT